MDAAGEVLTLEEAARRLRFSVRTVRKMCSSGELKAKKVRTEWRIAPEALKDLMNDNEKAPTL